MSEWTPKVGDKVMVGEWGPYEVEHQSLPGGAADIRNERGHRWCVDPIWLTPAPEPEPDEPTASGALVRDGDGRLWVHSPIEGLPDSPAWDALDRLSSRWISLPRPITVVLADPAEVEQLRADLKASEAQASELQRRIDRALNVTDDANRIGNVTRPRLRRTLRGEW